MQEDFLNELGELALASRLKRLAERMHADVAGTYAHFDINTQPKWFPLIALLDKKQSISVVQASNLLGISQPAISQFCKQLSAKGLVTISVAKNDSRKRLIALSDNGKAQVEKMRPMWAAVKKSAELLCIENNNDFFNALLTLERALDERSLTSRALQQESQGKEA